MLMLIVMDDHPAAPPLLYHVDRFRRCDEILRWLINNYLIGRKFVEWVRHEHGNSILRAGAHVLMKIDRDRVIKPVIGGRDYILN